MPFDTHHPVHRQLQQQPQRQMDRQQQQSSGTGEFQPGHGRQMGEKGEQADMRPSGPDRGAAKAAMERRLASGDASSRNPRGQDAG